MRHLLLSACSRMIAEGCSAARGQSFLPSVCSTSSHFASSFAGVISVFKPRFYRASPASFTGHPTAQLQPGPVVPVEITRELEQIDSFLKKSSRIDGRKRLELSSTEVPFPVPEHEIEPGVLTGKCHLSACVHKYASAGAESHVMHDGAYLRSIWPCKLLEPMAFKSVPTSVHDNSISFELQSCDSGLHQLDAHVRPRAGSNFCKWLHRAGRVPGAIFSLPGEKSINIHMDKLAADKLVRMYGRNGCLVRVLHVRILDPNDPSKVLANVRAKPQHLHINARTLAIENLDLIYLPHDRVISVQLPIKLINGDASPGVRKGGWMNMERRTVKYQCLGSSLPPYVEVDVKDMELETRLLIRDLPVPEGTRIAGNIFDKTVVRCTVEVGKD